MKESERVKGQKVKSKVKGQKESRGALAREVMRRGKERRKVVLFFPFPVTPLALFAVHASRVKKKMTIQVSEYTVLPMLVSKKNRPLRLFDPIVKW